MMSVVTASPGMAARSLRDALEIALARVAPQHALEHARRPRLHRQVHVLAHGVRLGHRGNDAIAEVVRMRAREAQRGERPARAPTARSRSAKSCSPS